MFQSVQSGNDDDLSNLPVRQTHAPLVDGASIKVVVSGDGAVGKTSLLISYATNAFPDEYVPSMFDNYDANVMFNGVRVTLRLWDTCTMEDYDRSLDNVKNKWYPELREHMPTTPIILCGTKLDLLHDPDTLNGLERNGYSPPPSKKEILTVCRDCNFSHYVECSAKTQKGLKEVFMTAMSVVFHPQPQKRWGLFDFLKPKQPADVVGLTVTWEDRLAEIERGERAEVESITKSLRQRRDDARKMAQVFSRLSHDVILHILWFFHVLNFPDDIVELNPRVMYFSSRLGLDLSDKSIRMGMFGAFHSKRVRGRKIFQLFFNFRLSKFSSVSALRLLPVVFRSLVWKSDPANETYNRSVLCRNPFSGINSCVMVDCTVSDLHNLAVFSWKASHSDFYGKLERMQIDFCGSPIPQSTVTLPFLDTVMSGVFPAQLQFLRAIADPGRANFPPTFVLTASSSDSMVGKQTLQHLKVLILERFVPRDLEVSFPNLESFALKLDATANPGPVLIDQASIQSWFLGKESLPFLRSLFFVGVDFGACKVVGDVLKKKGIVDVVFSSCRVDLESFSYIGEFTQASTLSFFGFTSDSRLDVVFPPLLLKRLKEAPNKPHYFCRGKTPNHLHFGPGSSSAELESRTYFDSFVKKCSWAVKP